MKFGICNLSVIPLRLNPSDTSEMVSQVLFGEHFTILERQKYWSRISLAFDNYEGWIDNKQYETIKENVFFKLNKNQLIMAGEFIDIVINKNNNLITVPIGSNLPFYSDKKLKINGVKYDYEGEIYDTQYSKNALLEISYIFINSPYLWGGRTPFGIDCSGFTQMVYKLCGYKLFRDASEQVTQGESLNFVEESEPGDLAFFDNEEGEIVHVGIVLKDNNIIHAHGKVRIDKFDHSGIFNVDTKRYTHKLRVIKRVI